MTGHEIWHVAIAPPHTIETNLIEKVAAIVGKDLYGMRLVLAGEIPRIIAHYDTMEMAESTARNLRALNLAVIVCKDSELRSLPQPYRAQTLKFEGQSIQFCNKSGQARKLESNNVFLIIKGRMQSYTDKEVTKTRRKLSLGATVITGGIPVWRRIKETTTVESIQSECFIRLYDHASPEPGVEILQHDFDYSFLGIQMASSSLANFNIAVAKIRDIFTQAIFDDRLMKPFRVDTPSKMPWDNIMVSCRLIYLYYRAVSNLDSSV